MEKQVLKKEEKTFVNGFIISVQLPGVPPKQSFVDTSSALAETVLLFLALLLMLSFWFKLL